MTITAIERFEAARKVVEETGENRPDYRAASKDDQREWMHVEYAAKSDLRDVEEALARLISSGYNDLVPEDMVVCEESEESIGQGVIYQEKCYALNDVVGNMTDGIIDVVDVTRMAKLDEIPPAPGMRPAEVDRDVEVEGEIIGEDLSSLAAETIRALVEHHKRVLDLTRRLDDASMAEDLEITRETGALWDRWSSVLCEARTKAAQALAYAVCATDRAFEMKALDEPGATFPTMSVEIREGLVMTRERTDSGRPGFVEVIYADRPASGDRIFD